MQLGSAKHRWVTVAGHLVTRYASTASRLGSDRERLYTSSSASEPEKARPCTPSTAHHNYN